MKTVLLNNGVEMPMLGFGTFKMTDPDECKRSVLDALQTGYRLIDTAQAYNNEEAVGAAIRESGVARKDLFLTTKVWFKSYEAGVARESVLTSMKKLGVDYLDLVLLHWPFGNYYAAWRDLEALYAEGKIRAIGVSNFNPDRLIDLISFNKVVPAVNQIETHLLCQRVAEHGWMEKYHVAHEAYAPLGQGRKNEMFESPALLAIAEKYGKTPAQIALRFLIESGVTVIPKSVHTERIRENFDLFGFDFTSDEMAALRALDQRLVMIGNPESPERTEKAMTW